MTEHHRIANEHLTIDVAARGAELQSVRTPDGTEWLWQGDAQWWSYRSPLLFPVIGTSPEGRVTIDGTPHEMLPHGFTRVSDFAPDGHTADTVRFVLRDSDVTRAAYPFAFRLAVEYRLDGATLVVTATVHNDDDRPMPFQFGFHPAFALPPATGAGHRAVLPSGAEPMMRRPAPSGLMRTNLQPSGFAQGSLPLVPDLFVEGARVFETGAGDSCGLRFESGASVTLMARNLPVLALWQKPAAPFLCIEPWTGVPPDVGGEAAMEHRPMVHSLAPGASESFAMELTFRP